MYGGARGEGEGAGSEQAVAVLFDGMFDQLFDEMFDQLFDGMFDRLLDGMFDRLFDGMFDRLFDRLFDRTGSTVRSTVFQPNAWTHVRSKD